MILTYWILMSIFLVVGFLGTVISMIVFFVYKGYDADYTNNAQVAVKIFFTMLLLAVVWPVVLPVAFAWGVFKALTYKPDK